MLEFDVPDLHHHWLSAKPHGGHQLVRVSRNHVQEQNCVAGLDDVVNRKAHCIKRRLVQVHWQEEDACYITRDYRRRH